LTTTVEVRKAVAASRRREKKATKILAAHYDAKHDTIVADLSTGASIVVPRHSVPGFTKAGRRALSNLEVTPGGEGVWSDVADDGVLLEQLLVLAAGAATIGTIGARLNAAKKSVARAAASRANGTKGGRPRTSAA
jgi:hypothetical protein